MCYHIFMSIYEEAKLSDFIIAFLLSNRSKSIMSRVLWERVKKRRLVSQKNFNQSIYRLKRKGLLVVGENGIEIVYDKVRKNLKYKLLNIKPKGDSKVLVLFDIPEKERKTRNWLRNQIKDWDFKMIQKSVWLGKGPLPKEFYDHVKFLGIEKDIKVFNVQSK